jgi:hypothetical protein
MIRGTEEFSVWAGFPDMPAPASYLTSNANAFTGRHERAEAGLHRFIAAFA